MGDIKLTRSQRRILQSVAPGPVGIGALSILLQVAGEQDRKTKMARRRWLKNRRTHEEVA